MSDFLVALLLIVALASVANFGTDGASHKSCGSGGFALIEAC